MLRIVRRLRPPVVAFLLILLASARIASTWRIYTATADEATHVGAGLQLYETHTYELQPYNPPLPRLVWSLAPYLSGMRFVEVGDYGQWLHSVFYGHGNYKDNVARSRPGNLVFFVIAAICVWRIASDAFGEEGGLMALLLFTVEPVMLGYSGLVTHDTPGVAGVALALLAFERWMSKPTAARAIAVGAAYAFAILCKFSCIAFVPAVCGVIYVVRIATDERTRSTLRRIGPALAVAVPVMLLIVWAGYAFTLRRFLEGFLGILTLDREGFEAYAIGRVTTHGWWWYFPLAVAIKSTILLLLLVFMAPVILWRERLLLTRWGQYAAAAVVTLVITMHSSLDIGVRYVLPIYVLLSLAATAVMVGPIRKFAIVVLIMQIAVSFAAHPDYFPYFNAIAGRDPSWFMVDSNLDWGQDVFRLRAVLHEEHVDEIGLSLFGPADYDALHFPPHYAVSPWIPAHGWIAVSVHSYRIARTKSGGWGWLEGQPYRQVGKSIRLYHIL